MTRSLVDVLLPLALDRPFTYAVPEDFSVSAGDLVRVPLGGREAPGAVWGEAEVDAESASKRIKTIKGLIDAPPLTPEQMRFVEWVARYTLTPLGMVLRMALRGAGDPGAGPVVRLLVPTGQYPARLTEARRKVLAVAGREALTKAELMRTANVSASVVDALLNDGALAVHEAFEPAPGSTVDPDHGMPILDGDQAETARALVEAVSAKSFSTHLLDGVTGAGKTEVYLEAVAEALRLGRQALILLPEIALTKAIVDRVTARFGTPPGEWHSTVTPKRRARLRQGIASGETRIVVGARSALFLPFRDLGLIVVDEEHDAGFKQDDMPIYHARDMAVVRARLSEAPAILVSATPSIESLVNARAGRYVRHVLTRRYRGRPLPTIALVNLLDEPPTPGRWISPSLETATRETLERGEQGLLFLNRRGYAPLTVCRGCGHRFSCPNCTSWLVEHRFRGQLMCHHCGHVEPVPHACPNCDSPAEKLAAVGPGVERIRDEAKALFPEARLSILSSDITIGAERIRSELKAVAEHEIDLVIGTQLVTKGHHFPDLTLVGVVDADVGLGTADPRAAERTFQLLEQVTGRAGRGERPGRALIQTHDPNHPVMRALANHDRDAFYAAEIAARAEAALPPFGRLASLIVSAADRGSAEAHARALARAFPDNVDAHLLGPAEPPIPMIRGRHRMRLIVRAPRTEDLPGLVRTWLAAAPQPRGNVAVNVDMDPISFL